MREGFHAPVVGGGYDDIQDGGRKLIPTTHHRSTKSSLITTGVPEYPLVKFGKFTSSFL